MATYDQLNSARNSPYGHQPTSPYGSGDPYYNESSGYITAQPAKKSVSPWIKIGIPVLILVVIGGVVGGIVGAHKHKSTSGSSSSAASAAASAQLAVGIFATSTDSFYMVPVYPSTVSYLMKWHFSMVISLTTVRPTLQFSQRPHSFRATMLLTLGLQILFNPPIRVRRPYERIAPASLPLLTSGLLCLNSSLVIRTCSHGITPFLKTPRNTIICPPLYISWMATAVSWIMHVRLNRESRHLHMYIACPMTPNGLTERF